MIRLFPQRAYFVRFKTTKGINTAPIEFTSNLSASSHKIEKVLSCTQDVTHIPFEVKHVDANIQKQRQEIRSQNQTLKQQLVPYLQLTKPRLTALVTLSAICSYALTPFSASIPQLVSLTLGTALASGSANAINMAREPDFDRQMVRTQARPVVRGAVSPANAYRFAALAGTTGVGILYLGANPTVAALGLANIALYAWMYTSLKRRHIINTWVGAVVGALPPLMGWAVSSPLSDPSAWCLAALLYAWQFPHFNTLSHNIRQEYKNAGYVMAAWKNPMLNARVALRYSLLMFPICFGLSYFGCTDWYFQFDSGLVNVWMSYWAAKFWWQQRKNYSGSGPTSEGIKLANVYARKTFWVSVWQLPAMLIFAILHKQGRWDWVSERFA